MITRKILIITIFVLFTFQVSGQTKMGTSLNHLTDLEGMIYLQEGRCEQVSSFDRTGGNDDGFNGTYSYLRKDDKGEYVIMESDNPGAIVQIWFTNITTADRIKFYFDGEKEPAIDMDIKEFFSGKVYPFVNPLTGDDDMSSGGFVCYVPMPYKKSCIITTTKVARFYHIDYRVFKNGEGIQTFDPDFSEEKKNEFDRILKMCENCEVNLNGTKKLSGKTEIPAKENTRIFDLDGPKIIKRIEFKIHGLSKSVNLKKLVLRAWWEESEVPGVESPFIDFFGTGYGTKNFKSIPLGINDNLFYCNFPMPFTENAVFEMENDNVEDIEIEYEIYYREAPALKKEKFAYFHAQWHETRTEYMIPFEILWAKGEGHYAGVNMTMQGFNNISFLEGDERIYVEGEALPIWVGTGTEDYFNGGWYFNRGTFDLPYHGLTVKQPERGRISVYRYHITDSVPFKHNVFVGIEHGSKNNYADAYYSCTVYWYQTLPYEKTFEIIDVSNLTYPRSTLRKTDDLIELSDKVNLDDYSGQDIITLKWEELTDDWEGSEEVILAANEKNDYFKFDFNIKVSDIYEIKVYYGKGPKRGIFSVYVDDQKVLSSVNAYSEVNEIFNESDPFKIRLKKGIHTVKFNVENKYENAEGYNVGVDFLRVNSAANFIQNWYILGPFPADEGKNFDREFSPEKEINLDASYQGKNGKSIKWKKVTAKKDFIDFTEHFIDKEEGIAYGYCKVYSPEERNVMIYAGSDDGIKIFMNGKQVWSNPVYRGAAKDQDNVRVKLKKGWNHLLVKISQGVGGWQYCIRVSNYDGEIKFDTE